MEKLMTRIMAVIYLLTSIISLTVGLITEGDYHLTFYASLILFNLSVIYLKLMEK